MFRQLFKILELMGYDWAKKCVHVNFGMVKLPRVLYLFLATPTDIQDKDTGKETKMSTRAGNVVMLDETLNKAQKVIYDKMMEDTKGVVYSSQCFFLNLRQIERD